MRWSELVLFIYFAYAAALAMLLPVSGEVRVVSVVLNLTILAGYALLIYAHGLRGRKLLDVTRDWLPLVLLLLAYREMGWLAPRTHAYSLERSWIAVDRLVLRTWHVHDAIEWLGPVMPSILEIAYSLVYVTAPFGLAMLYVYGARTRSERYLLILVLGVLLSYAQFPFWPSEPPRAVFPGEDAPSMQTIFRRFNWFLLGGYGIHTSVFPERARLRRFCGGIWREAGATRKAMGVAFSSRDGGADRNSDGLRPLSLCGGRRGRFCGECGGVGAGLARRTVFARLILHQAPHVFATAGKSVPTGRRVGFMEDVTGRTGEWQRRAALDQGFAAGAVLGYGRRLRGLGALRGRNRHGRGF